MKKLAILIPCILLLLIGVFAYTVTHKTPTDSRITSHETSTSSVISADKPAPEESMADGPKGFSKDIAKSKGLRGEKPEESARPEYDPSSPYYLSSEAREKLSNLGLFNEAATEKIFEIRRKMIDRHFDSKNMSAELKKKIHASENGKLSKEEILSLLPKDLASDFEEMVNRVNK